MSAPKVTPWYPASVKPARVGMYQRNLSGQTRYAWWDGAAWGLTLPNVERAIRGSRIPTCYDNLEWRGRTAK